MNDNGVGIFRSYLRLFIGIAVSLLFVTVPACAQQEVPNLPNGIQSPQNVRAQQNGNSPNTLSGEAASNMNDRLMQLAAALKTTQGEYLIGPGDILSMEVFDVPELTRDLHVSETGYVSLPLVRAPLYINGLTTLQLEDKIKDLLQDNGLISDPQVTVSLKEQHSQPVTVIGAVRQPTVFEAGRQTTLLEVLSRAGGVADDAGSIVMITRTPVASQGSPAENAAAIGASPEAAADAATAAALGPKAETFTINLNDLLDAGDSRFNIPIIGGDVVSVPRAGIIYVVGAVNHPGGFIMTNDWDRMTTMKAVALAGGMTSTAKLTHAVILRRDPDTGKREQVDVDLRRVLHLKGEDAALQASDILYVPDSSGKKALHEAGNIAVSLATSVALIRATQ